MSTSVQRRWTRSGTRLRRRLTVGLVFVVLFVGSVSVAAASSGRSPWSNSDDPGALFTEAPPVVADYFPVGYAAEPILVSGQIDEEAGTVTLPLRRGEMADGRPIWFVITESSDRSLARRIGATWSPKLANAPDEAVRMAHGRPRRQGSRGSGLVFESGTVDFSPDRVVVPGPAPEFFPPAEAKPGSVGDADYSPLVRLDHPRGAVLNASVVAFDVTPEQIEFPDGGVDYTLVMDRVVAISPTEETVTLFLNVGTSSARPVLFISLDSNSEVVSALEATTHAPALSNLVFGRNDASDSTVSANYIVANGPTGADNPQRQGLNSALSDPGAQVLDIFDGAPGILNGKAYSPMWDLYVGVWTPEAIDAGYPARITSELEVVQLARQGWFTSPDGSPLASSGLISNCPLIGHL